MTYRCICQLEVSERFKFPALLISDVKYLSKIWKHCLLDSQIVCSLLICPTFLANASRQSNSMYSSGISTFLADTSSGLSNSMYSSGMSTCLMLLDSQIVCTLLICPLGWCSGAIIIHLQSCRLKCLYLVLHYNTKVCNINVFLIYCVDSENKVCIELNFLSFVIVILIFLLYGEIIVYYVNTMISKADYVIPDHMKWHGIKSIFTSENFVYNVWTYEKYYWFLKECYWLVSQLQ